MPGYVLSARLEVNGAGSFISDLDRAAKAALDASEKFAKLKNVDIALEVRGAKDFIADMEKASKVAGEAAAKIEKLGTTDTRLEVKGSAEFNADMERAAAVAGDAAAKIERLGTADIKLEVKGAAQFEADMRSAATAAAEADQRIEQVGRNSGTQLRGAADEAGLLSRGFHDVLDSAKTLASFQLVMGIQQGLAEAATAILDFNKGITNALSIQPQAAMFRGEMEQTARSISKDLGIPVGEVADAFYFLASAGLSVQEQLAAIGPVATFAKAGMLDLEKATQVATQATAIFARDGYTMPQILDEISQAANLSQGTIGQFADALTNKAGTAAVQFHQSLEVTLGTLAAFAERGISGKTAGEQFSIVLRDLSIKAVKNKEAFAEMGISVFDNAGQMKPLTDIIHNLQGVLGGMSDEVRTATLLQLGFTQRNVQVINTLLQAGDRVDYFTQKMKEANGVTREVAEVQLTSLQAKLDRLKAITIDFAITGFEKLVAAGQWVVDTFEPALRSLGPAAKAFVDGIGGVVAAVAPLVGGAIITGLEALAVVVQAIGNFAAQHTGAIEAFGAAIAAIAVGHLVTEVAALTLSIAGPLLGALSSAVAGVLAFSGEMAVAARSGSVLEVLRSGWQSIGDAIRDSPMVGIGLFVTGMALMANEVRKNQQDAENYAKAIQAAFDITKIGGLTDSVVALQGQAEQLRTNAKEARGFGDFLRTTADIIPFIDFSNTSIDLYGAAKAAEELARHTQEVASTSNEAVTALANWANGVPTFGPFIGDLGAMNTMIAELGRESGLASGQIQITAERLVAIGEANNIDFSKPWQEWLPVLFEIGVAQTGITQNLIGLGVSASDAAALAGTLTDETQGMGDAAADSAKEFDALTKAIEGMIDGPLNKFASEGDVLEAMIKLREETDKYGLALDATTAGGRAVRDALVDVVGAQKDFAKAQADGDPAIYAEKIGAARGQIIDYAMSLGFSAEQAGALADSLGLIPEVKDVAIAVSTEGDIQAAQAIDDAAAARTAMVSVLVDREAAGIDLDGWANTARSTTVTAEADTGPASTEIDGWARQPRTATVTAQADTAAAAVALDAVTVARAAFIEAWDGGTAADVGARIAAAAVSRAAFIEAWDGGTAASVESKIAAAAVARAAYIEAWDGGTAAWVSRALDAAAVARTAVINVVLNAASNIGAAAADVVGGYWDKGGVVDYFAGGAENHVAQIAPAGSWRVWAEPETGGESYIPLHPSKRARSTEIWRQTGKRLGVMQQYASGGVTQSAARVAGGTGGSVSVMVSPGAIQANVSAAIGADPGHLAGLIATAVAPALDEFAIDLATQIRRRQG